MGGSQVTGDSLWEITKNYTSYTEKAFGLKISKDPLNLTGLNTKRDSGVAAVHALGVSTENKEKNIKINKIKTKTTVVRFNFRIKTKRQLPRKRCVAIKTVENNNRVYSERERVSINAIIKALQRDLKVYRKDLMPTIFKKLLLLKKYKLNNKKSKKQNETKRTKSGKERKKERNNKN